MDGKSIYEQVTDSLGVNGSFDLYTANFVAANKATSLARLGIDMDADAICHIFRYEDKLMAFFVVGRSLLIGTDALDWLKEYHSFNKSAVEKAIQQIVSFAAEEQPGPEGITMPFKDSRNKAWRSFRAKSAIQLPTVDDVRKKARLRKF